MNFLDTFFENKNTEINDTNKSCSVYYRKEASEQDFEAVANLLKGNGCTKRKESYFGACHRFEAYEGENEGVFINYYKNTDVLTVVTESNCRYFEFSDTLCGVKVKPQISQIHLEDFGMSYAVRLSDGRFIVIDGGREFEPDADRLFNCIKEGTPDGKPVIAAWIMTHAHNDHFHCFLPFFDKYGNDVIIERFLYNFPTVMTQSIIRDLSTAIKDLITTVLHMEIFLLWKKGYPKAVQRYICPTPDKSTL